MANFALFAGDAHYPAGGFHDLIGTFDTVAEARARFAQGREPEWYTETISFEWGHIVDLTHAEMVLVWAVVSESKRATKTRPAVLAEYDWVAPRD
jgi:hypothetical protein